MSPAIRWRAFWILAVAINLAAFLMARFVPKPAVGAGAALDVAVTVPALYFLLIVRAGLQPLISIAPICLLGLLRATYLAPRVAFTRPVVAAAVEIALVALVVSRLRKGAPQSRLDAVIAGEVTMLYYALASWRRRPEIPDGARAFPIHERSGAAALFGALAAVSVMEAGLVHMVVMRWSTAAAWTLTALSLYGSLLLVAIARSLVLRPVLVTADEVVLRSGMLWTLRVPHSGVAAVERPGAPCELRMPLAAEPNLVLRLREPIVATGIYGLKRRVNAVAVSIDEPAEFERALSQT